MVSRAKGKNKYNGLPECMLALAVLISFSSFFFLRNLLVQFFSKLDS